MIPCPAYCPRRTRRFECGSRLRSSASVESGGPARISYFVAALPANPEGLSRVANIKSQIKRNKQNEKAHQRNKAAKSTLRSSVRKFREAADAGNLDDAGTAL